MFVGLIGCLATACGTAGGGKEAEQHPERRMKAAFAAFEEREMCALFNLSFYSIAVASERLMSSDTLRLRNRRPNSFLIAVAFYPCFSHVCACSVVHASP